MKIRPFIILCILLGATGASANSTEGRNRFPGSQLRGLGGIQALLKDRKNNSLNPSTQIANYRIENGTTRTYTIREAVLNGQTVREYVLPNGQIFALTWRGMAQPDLSLLLGSYYGEFKKVAQDPQNQGRHNQQKISSQHLIVERFGHMRDVRGKAYIAQLMPSGLSPQELE